MKPEKRDYVLYRMGLAGETLEEARVLLETSHPRGAVNRLYYACFYAVSALLFIGDHRSTKHTGVRALFSQHCVKTGLFPKEMGKFYNALFENRMSGDYRDQSAFSERDVESWLDKAEMFVAQIAKHIQEQLPSHQNGPQGGNHD